MKSTKKTASATKRNTRGKPAKRRRYSKSVRRVVAASVTLLSILAVCCIAVGGYGWYLLNKINIDDDGGSLPSDFSYPEGEGPESIPDISFDSDPYENATTVADIPVMGDTEDVTNILLIGIDGRTNYSARSDSNMIVSINKKKKTIKFVSLLRDTCVTIPGRDKDGDGKDDYNKLNAAYAFGQEKLLFKTIEQNFRLKIDKYVGVKFVVFPIAVDKLGGIDIELTAKEATQIPKAGTTVTVETGDPNFVPMDNRAGTYHLNGFQTLQYVRIRHIDSDFGRVQRQQKAMNILLDKARRADIFTLMGMLDELLPQVKTNMGRGEVLNYVMDAGAYLSYDIMTTYHVPQDGAFLNKTINGGAMLVLKDPKQSVTDLHTYLYA